MPVVKVTEWHRALGRKHGLASHFDVKNSGKERNYGVDLSEEDWRRNAIMGSTCQVVAADYLDLRNTGVDKRRADLADKIEVRGRFNVPGRDNLGVRPVDKFLHCPYLLVRIDEDMEHADVVGWLLGIEAKWRGEHGVNAVWGEHSKCWYVSEPYHSVESLLDWICCGMPRHTWRINP